MVRVAVVGPFSGPRAAWGELLTDAVAAVTDSALDGLDWDFLDDRGDAAEAVARAGEVVADGGFSAVVGHFNSGGARAALPYYRAAALPAVFPLATEPGLLTGYPGAALRLCPDDDGQARVLVRACGQRGDVYVVSDGSGYGDALATRVEAVAGERAVRRGSPADVEGGSLVLCGAHHGVADLLRHHTFVADRVVVTDDCDIPEFADLAGPAASNVSVARLTGGPRTVVVTAVTAVAACLTKHPELRHGELLDAIRGELALELDADGDLACGSSGTGWEVAPVRRTEPVAATVSVIGAGITGLCAAADLAESGIPVRLWDGGADTSATAVSGGLVRSFALSAPARELACRSMRMLWGTPERGPAHGFRRTGALTLFGPEHEDAVVASGAEIWRPARLRHHWPDVDTSGLAGAVWEPDGGYVVAPVAMAALRDRVIRAGASIRRERVSSLATIDTPGVVVAAGCAGPDLLADSWPPDLPTRTKRIRYGIFDRAGHNLPTIVDLITDMWARPDGAHGLLVGVPVDEWDVPARGGSGLSTEQVDLIRAGVRGRLPFVEQAEFLVGRYGTDLYTEDGPLLVTPSASRQVLFVGAGSGGGFKSAPAVGQQVTEVVRGWTGT